MPLNVLAASTSHGDWGFLYEFHFALSGGAVVVSSPYSISSGEVPELPIGRWLLEVKDSNNQSLQVYPFDPVLLAKDGDFTIFVPLESRGAIADVRGPDGIVSAQIDISMSRVCNDDGICLADAGESSNNCPTDCASAVMRASPTSVLGATIADQVPFRSALGSYLMKLSAAIAGIVVMVGVVQLLDNRRRT